MTRGRKPTPEHLRLVSGTHREDRHGPAAEAKERAASSLHAFGAMTRPKYLKGEARNAWIRFIQPADWLDASREPAAIAFCELWAEFRTSPAAFPAAKHSQMRGYMAELGITDQRNRRRAEPPPEADEFFDA